MPTIQELKAQYDSLNELDNTFSMGREGKINADCLIVFDYEYAGQEVEVSIDTDEFTAVCPWTGLPDFGTLTIRYVPDKTCIELKSLKYYLLSFTNVGIVQEHAANRVLNDLVALCGPVRMDITMDYKVRGGLHTVVTAKYEQE